MGVKVAMVQMQGLATKEENIAKATKHIGVAVADGAEIVCLQELFNTIYFCYEANPEYFDLAEPIPGPTINAMAEVAMKHGIVLVAPIYEKAMAGELYNTATVLGPDGAILGKYRKSSIPLVTTPTTCGYEKYYFRPGNTGFEVFPTPFGIKVGILICHDRNFPEAARILGLRGADIVLMPFATAGDTLYRWEVLTRAHAMANSYYVGSVNRVGLDMGGSPTQVYYGSSFFADFRGQIISQAGDKEDEVIYAELDLDAMARDRNECAWYRDRRPDLYGDLVKP
jgi:N-carbamoylputrescine amidase